MHLNEMDHRHPHQETKTNNLVEPFKMMDGFHEGFSMTLYVGRSEQQGNREVNKNSSAGKKETRLPYANMMVSPKIQNLMSSADKRRYNNIAFKTEIRGQTLIVTRTDSNKGWGFELQLKAYYVKKSIGTHYRAFDFDFKNEESAVTLSLCPDQKFRCIPKAVIFKDEIVIMTTAKIFDGSIKRSGIPGRFLRDINKNIRLHNKSAKKKNSLNAIAVAEYAISREVSTHGVTANHTRVDIVGYNRKLVGVEIGSTMKIIEDMSVALDDMSSGLTVSHHSEASEASYDLLSAQAYDIPILIKVRMWRKTHAVSPQLMGSREKSIIL